MHRACFEFACQPTYQSTHRVDRVGENHSRDQPDNRLACHICRFSHEDIHCPSSHHNCRTMASFFTTWFSHPSTTAVLTKVVLPSSCRHDLGIIQPSMTSNAMPIKCVHPAHCPEIRSYALPTGSNTLSSVPYPTCICPKITKRGHTRITSCARNAHPHFMNQSRWPRGGPCLRMRSVCRGACSMQTTSERGYWKAEKPYRGVSGEP